MTIEIGEDERVALAAIYHRHLDEEWTARSCDWYEDEQVAHAKLEAMEAVLGILGLVFEVEYGRTKVELVEARP